MHPVMIVFQERVQLFLYPQLFIDLG